MKFGGSCLIDSESFHQILNIINKYLENSNIVSVSSALKGITNMLLDFYNKTCTEDTDCSVVLKQIKEKHLKLITQILEENSIEFMDTYNFLKTNIEELRQLGQVTRLIRPSPDIQDLVVSYGEKLSTYILAKFLNKNGITAKYLSSSDLILTDDNFERALPLLDPTENLMENTIGPLLEDDTYDVLCITGYYGASYDKKITTMGRGGTDLSAAVVGYSLRKLYNCKVIYWKDVSGILNADPTFVKDAALLKQISYIEAKELAHFGSKVLHPLCLDINEKGNIPSEIRPFRNPDEEDFTTITKEVITGGKVVKAITFIYQLSLITLESDTMVPLSGTASKLFSLLEDNNIAIVFISQSSSENNITFGIDYEDSDKVERVLRNSEYFGKQWFQIKVDNEISLIALIGSDLLHTPGIAGKVFMSLGENKINIKALAQGSSELNFTAIIDRENCKKAINVLYDEFIREK